jgi:uncharacterized protein YegJ (DUF2314 family)
MAMRELPITYNQLKSNVIDAAVDYYNTRSDEAHQRLHQAVDKLVNRPGAIAMSAHAITQYQKRSGTKTFTKATKNLRKILDIAENVDIKTRYRLRQLLNHNLEEADYYKSGNWVLVVVNNELRTVHNGEAGRWR